MGDSTESLARTAEAGPSAMYRGRLDARKASLATHRRTEGLVANLRIVIFIVAAILVWLAIDRRVEPVWPAVPWMAFVGLVAAHISLRRRIGKAERAVAFYERGLDRIEGRWTGRGEDGGQFLDDTHPFAGDLDLFGPGSLFERINTARTAGGEAQLASWLTRPAGHRGEILARQVAVADLAGRVDFREDIDGLGGDVRVGLKPDGLVAWGEAGPILPEGSGVRRVAVGLGAAGVAGLFAWAAGWAGLSPFFAAVLGELAYWGWLRSRTRRVLGPVDSRAGELSLLADLLRRIEGEDFGAERLRTLRDDLATGGETPSRRIGRLAGLVRRLDSTRNPMFGPFAALVLAGTRLAFAVETWRRDSGPSIARWLAVVGEVEAFGSLGAYAFENPGDPYPDVVDDGPLFDGRGVGHPLLSRDRCVRNDVRLGGDLRVLIVSGSNMSGKSTLLRTIGANVVLATAGAPVRAARLRLSPLSLGATLRVQDSLQAGTSRFYAELTRLREVVRLAGGSPPLLFLLDEIFHGTNSDDRRLGAEGVVRGLIEAGAIGLVTTHDLALAAIAEGLAPRAANVHFSDHFEGGALVFDYTMRPGVVRHSNAIALMRAVGLDV